MNAFARIALLSTALLLHASMAVAQSPKTESLADITRLDGPSRQQRLVDGARREGEVTIYESMTAEDINPIIDAFSRKYGIKVKVWRASSENVLERVLNEARAGRFEVDVVENNAPEMEALHRERMLQPLTSPYFEQLLPQAIPAHKEWVGHTIDVFVQAYNTDSVKKDELPKTYQDLLDPKWKGRLGIEADDQAWFATVVQEMGQEQGLKLFREIVATQGVSVRKGHTLLANLVASGEVPLGITLYNNKPEQLKLKGAPIEWFVMQPVVAQFRSVGVVRRSSHPYAAILFLDFMLSEAQQISFGRKYLPTNTRFDAPLAKQPLKFIDPAQSVDMQDAWRKMYEDVVVKRAKP